MNVLVYSGPGTTQDSVKSCLESLRQFLSPYYAVTDVGAKTLIEEPWAEKTSLLVIPGGADLPYCKELNGRGNTAITKFVRKGGKFIGFCAGGYYGSARCEFEVGNLAMEVSGPRELKFFPGTARGSAYNGFIYNSQAGARATIVSLNNGSLGLDFTECVNYYNGGSVFLDATKYPNVEVLASYIDPLSVESDDAKAAVVLCKVGKGSAILTGTHPEFAPEFMKQTDDETYQEILAKIKEDDSHRRQFFRSLLQKLDLKVGDGQQAVPRLTPLYLSSVRSGTIEHLLEDFSEQIGFENDLLKGNNDTFQFHESNANVAHLRQQSEYEDPETVVKDVYVIGASFRENNPSSYFNHVLYYDTLEKLWAQRGLEVGEFGSAILYGEVVTSTSTMLHKNYNMLKYMPNGLTAVGTTQIAGRGRGGNVWVNPQGVLASSIIMHLPISKATTAPIVFVQYLCSLAMVEAVLGYGEGYETMPIKIKWPNDIYGLKPEYVGQEEGESPEPKYAKIGGLLVNVNIIEGKYVVVVGTGINVSNIAPTTSLNVILASLNKVRASRGSQPLEPYRQEALLARYMYVLENMFVAFTNSGFSQFLDLYYQRWLHNKQVVRVESHNNTRAIIVGISSDWGFLVVEAIDDKGNYTGNRFQLQPDGNSFDMFKGLIFRKSYN